MERTPNWQRQAWLTEYQVCQQESDSNTLRYWTLAGIFIGFSAVLLGAILYVRATNIRLDACTLHTIISVVGSGMILVLVFLRFLLKRTQYLMDRNYERMREIELRLGMCKSLRVLILDRWNKMQRKLGFKNVDKLSDHELDRIWQKTLEGGKKEEEIAKGLSEESLQLLADRQEELFELCYRCKPQHWYERPSRYLHLPIILHILIGLWLFLVLSTWLLTWFAISTVIIAYLIYGLITYCITRCRSRHKASEKETSS